MKIDHRCRFLAWHLPGGVAIPERRLAVGAAPFWSGLHGRELNSSPLLLRVGRLRNTMGRQQNMYQIAVVCVLT